MTKPTSNKKAKKSSDSTTIKEEFDILKHYILRCPSVSQSSPAVQTCISALDTELKRIDRDMKLQQKFAKEKAEIHGSSEDAQSSSLYSLKDSDYQEEDDDVVCVEMSASTEDLLRNTSSANNDDVHLTEWQDVGSASAMSGSVTSPGREKHVLVNKERDDAPSALGLSLAQCAISDMSSANILVSTPVAALALALHAALRSDILGFKCTGIPEEEICFSTDPKKTSHKKKNGFAAPVRELPKGKFLPDNWDEFASTMVRSGRTSNTNNNDAKITLRYRKNGTGATILRVTQSVQEATLMAEICFGPSGGEPWVMNTPMNRHINVDGLNAALEKSPNVKPALHYKSLSMFLSDFCKNADLGIVKDNDSANVDINMADAVPNIPSISSSFKAVTSNNSRILYERESEFQSHPTIKDDLLRNDPQRRVLPGGDFAGDLMPSGIPAPGFANPDLGGGNKGGNLMGMNHPSFQRNFDPYDEEGRGIPDIGGLGMQPRFDPYYPQGLNGGRGGRFGPGRGPGRGRGRGGSRGSRDYSGDPNPDHERPPNSFNNDMFM